MYTRCSLPAHLAGSGQSNGATEPLVYPTLGWYRRPVDESREEGRVSPSSPFTKHRRLVGILLLTLIGPDFNAFYFYDGGRAGLVVAPLDFAHGQYHVSMTGKINHSECLKVFRNGLHEKFGLDEFPADSSAYIPFVLNLCPAVSSLCPTSASLR